MAHSSQIFGGAHVTAKGGGALWSTHAINKNCVARLPPLSPQKATISDTLSAQPLAAFAQPPASVARPAHVDRELGAPLLRRQPGWRRPRSGTRMPRRSSVLI